MSVYPWYARAAATVGRPVVLAAALAMSAPGEYALARLAGWAPAVAWLMPVTLSVYAGVAAVIAATRPRGAAGRVSAVVGSLAALGLALAAQMVAHLIETGHMASGAWLVAATSAVPPVVVAHLLHLASPPQGEPQPAKEPDGRGELETTPEPPQEADSDPAVLALLSAPEEAGNVVPVAVAETLTGVPASTIRTWLSRGLIQRRGRRGRAVLVDVRDVRAQRPETA
ncbi:hypothetical protein [Streptomyces sp. NPDC001380]|uniref:hypothetical protein n=1 Tax=Streptomyces sp. NPDC001380 TaxID=3364566 RepID=UPI0036C6A181